MRIRGSRECKECGTRWSYYETGSVECPDCGSMRSVGLDEERSLHTDGPADLDLSEVRDRVDRDPLVEVTDAAKSACRSYVRQRGFVRGGDLLDLDDTYLAAAELVQVADLVGRSFSPSEAEELYLLSLLEGADGGERPDPDRVPESMHAGRGLAYADAVDDYRREVVSWLDDATEGGDRSDSTGRAIREAFSSIDDHVRRVRALEGDVDPETAERLVAAVRDLGRAARGDEGSLVTARDRLDRL